MRAITFQVAFSLTFAALASGGGRAGIILDHSPATTGADLEFASGKPWLNQSTGQNFGEIVEFSTGATITGMDVYTRPNHASVGTPVVVRLWADASGAPGTLLANDSETLSIVDSDGAGTDPNVARAHADLATPLVLAAGVSYWIGMSGASANLTQYGLGGPDAPGDGRMAQFDGTAFQLVTATTGDMAFRLEGTLGTTVPEPSSWLTGASAVGLGLALARRRRAA